MKIQYAGPRPMISQKGISFKDGKEDKYVYLMIGIQILKAIDRSFDKNKMYAYDYSTKRVTDTEMMDTILKYEPELEKSIDERMDSFKEHLDEEIEQVRGRTNLTDLEKSTWVNNLELMEPYRMQRAVNKIYYMHCMHTIAEIIRREQIREIDVPFFEKFWHVLQTIQGEISEGRSSLRTSLKVEKDEDDNLIAKLSVQGW